MKKQDYATLAKIFKHEIQKYKGYIARGDGTEARNIGDQRAYMAIQIAAGDCARSLHVCPESFLKACGIE